MAPQRPKSPSPARLPAVGDTVVGLDPVPDTGAHPKPEPLPGPSASAPTGETTAPNSLVPSVRPPGLEVATTPATPLSEVAPQLAAQVLKAAATTTPGASSGPTEAVPL